MLLPQVKKSSNSDLKQSSNAAIQQLTIPNNNNKKPEIKDLAPQWLLVVLWCYGFLFDWARDDKSLWFCNPRGVSIIFNDVSNCIFQKYKQQVVNAVGAMEQEAGSGGWV